MLKLKPLIPGILVLLFLGSIIPASCASMTAQQQYVLADATYLKLRKNPAKQKYRDSWIKCIDQYQRVNSQFPQSSWAPAGMYRSAQLYLELHKRSRRARDKTEARDLLKRIQGHYPDSAYSERARHLLKRIASTPQAQPTVEKPTVEKRKTTLKRKTSLKKRTFIRRMPATIVAVAPKPTTPAPSVESTDSAPGSTDARVSGLRFWSNPEYTRVVIDATQNRNFAHRLLKKDPANGKPQRLYIDLNQSRLGKDVPKHTEINDNLLIQARAAQHTPHSVRVVIDIKSFDNYKVFSLKDPFRLVVDVWAKGANGKAKVAGLSKKSGNSKAYMSTDNIQSSAIAKQLALGVRRIVIDPGHGGKDPGAPGYLKNVWEKDVVLKISKRLAKKMRDRLKCDVILTRATDTYLTLEERTAIANTRNADLFISLHCNAAKNRKATGTETYFLNLATDDQAIEVAARENATSRKNISDLESILNDLMKNAKINESSRLATKVQGTMCKGLAKNYSKIKNLGVKQAPFYVLLGARMPSILIETSFLSNKTECKRLVSSTYQERLCDAIIDGVERYIKETNPTTL
ncbi:MAG: N-acetylmuramoyl-L-alanine amidase [Desulfobacterium sp.]|nr:N-acetylmuramoyl-L-alanine amidase [Desulfobacterium sp.]